MSDPLREALTLLDDALTVQRFPCRHKGIGMPGCVICDPRVYPGALADPRAVLDVPALTVERLSGAILACIDAAPSRKAWEDLSIDEQSRAILRALGEGAGE